MGLCTERGTATAVAKFVNGIIARWIRMPIDYGIWKIGQGTSKVKEVKLDSEEAA